MNEVKINIELGATERNSLQCCRRAVNDLITHGKLWRAGLGGLWFGGMMEIIEQVTMLSVSLTGAAL